MTHLREKVLPSVLTGILFVMPGCGKREEGVTTSTPWCADSAGAMVNEGKEVQSFRPFNIELDHRPEQGSDLKISLSCDQVPNLYESYNAWKTQDLISQEKRRYPLSAEKLPIVATRSGEMSVTVYIHAELLANLRLPVRVTITYPDGNSQATVVVLIEIDADGKVIKKTELRWPN